jgi:hypothetical protein
LKIELKLNNEAVSSDEEEPKQEKSKLEETLQFEENCLSLINQIQLKKWHSKVKIIVKDFEFTVTVLIDTDADLNCIKEGLVPTKYYSKSRETLRSTNGNKMQINFEISKAHICQNNVCFKTSFVLVKNMTDKVILGLPFITLLYRFTTNSDGLITYPLGEEVKFKFLTKQELNQLNAYKSNSKTHQLGFLQEEIKVKRIEEQLSNKILQQRIQLFEDRIKSEIYSDLPNAFWHRKKHVVKLPYVKEFNEGNISTKARPIQMSQEMMEFCHNEIDDLLHKGIIRKSKSPWSCSAFYVQKNTELERGAPRLVINYKPLNKVLEWIRYPIPNKRYLINRLSESVIFSKFDMKSGFWQIQIHESDKYKTTFVTPFGQYKWNVMPFGLKNAPSEFQNIMNDILSPLSKFSIVYIDDVLIFSKSIEEH